MTPDVIILCGGQGTRLRSVISNKQKCVAEVAGKPFLAALIEHIATFGFKRFILCTGHMSATVLDSLAIVSDELKLVISNETTPLGTGGAVKQALTMIETSNCLVLNGDSFCAVALDRFLAFHISKNALISIALAKVENKQDFGNVTLDKQDRITSFNEKTSTGSGLVNAGIYLFKKEVEAYLPNLQKFSLETNLFPALSGKNLFGFETDMPLYDIGTPERLQKASEYLKW